MPTVESCCLVSILFVCYFLLIANRKSFQYIIPYVSQEKWITTTDIGVIISSQTFGYSISKFLGGLAADHVDNRIMLSGSVLLTSIVTLIFTFSRNVLVCSILWFTSGCIQGVAWPAIAQVLRRKIPKEEFGTCWVVTSCSMNVASMIVPVISAYISELYNWTYSLLFIAGVTMLFSCLFITYLLRESSNTETKVTQEKNETAASVTLSAMFTNPIMLALCFGYFGISVIRYTATDWMPLYLTKELRMSPLYGSTFISLIETGGMVGSLVAAKVSDLCVKKNQTSHNARIPCIIVFTMIAVNATFVFASVVDSTQMMLASILAFFLGFSIYGPVNLYGVVAIECAPSHISGTCHTIVALAANLGATVAGYPISALSGLLGWTHTFYLIVILLGMSSMVLFYCRKSVPLKDKLKAE